MPTRKSGNPYRWFMLSFPFLIAFLLHLLLFATAPMVTVIIGEMNLSYAEFGLVFSAAMVSLILFRIPWGFIGDKIGYLGAFRIALPISAASAMLRAFSSSYTSLLLGQIFLGLGLAAVLPCLPLILKEWAGEKGLGFSTGIYVAGFAAGNATALGLTPQLLAMMKWRDVLLVYSGLATIVCGLWWGLARSSGKSRSGFQPGKFLKILKGRYVWVLLFFMIASMGSYDTLATWMPKILEMKNLSKSLASFLPLGFFLAGPIIGLASDRFPDRKKTVGILGLVAAAAIIGVNYAPFPLLLLCIFLAGFTTIGVLTITLAAPAENEELSASIGTVMGLISSLGNVGPLVMPVIFGLLIDCTGTFQASVFSVAALAGITFVLGSRATPAADTAN
jgi:ACS family glucarate transporter-like MFS transporter